jgi:hypothetical protein
MPTTKDRLRVLRNELQFLDKVVTGLRSNGGQPESLRTRRPVPRIGGPLARMAIVYCWILFQSRAVTKRFRAATFR